METIGEYLKRVRLERGLSVQQVALKTRINPVYIQDLEENRLDPFPGEVFARGFVQSYGRCLGLDDQETATLFARSAQSFFRERDEKKRTEKKSVEQAKVRHELRSRVIQAVIVVGLGLTLLTVYVINGGYLKGREPAVPAPISREVEPTPEPTLTAEPHPELSEPAVNKPAVRVPEAPTPVMAPAAPMVIPPKPLPETKAPAVAPLKKPEEKLPPIVNVPGQPPPAHPPGEALILVVEAVESSWVSAKIDGGDTKEVFLGRGEKVTWKASDHFLVSFGNAGGVTIQFNGKPLPPFGPKGAVVKDVRIGRE